MRKDSSATSPIRVTAATRPRLGADTRLHLRFECFNLDAVEETVSWIEAGRIDLLAFNEHTADIARDIERGKLGTYLGVNLARDEDREMCKLLQDHRAMMDWIAVPDFLVAYR